LNKPITNKNVKVSINEELVNEKSKNWMNMGSKILIENCSNGEINIK